MGNIERWHHAGICPESGKNCPMGGHAPGPDTASEPEIECLEAQLAGAVEERDRLRKAIHRYLRVEYPNGTTHHADVAAEMLRLAAAGGQSDASPAPPRQRHSSEEER